MHCHNFSNIQVLLSSKSPQVSLPSFLCFNNCCEDGPCYFTQEQKDTESLRDSHPKQADREKLKPQGARKVEHQGTGGAKMGTGWSILSIFATIPQVNISQYLQVAMFAGGNICRCQYLPHFLKSIFAGGRNETHLVEQQPLWVSIFAWSLILLGTVGLLVVSSTDLITTGGRGKE